MYVIDAWYGEEVQGTALEIVEAKAISDVWYDLVLPTHRILVCKMRACNNQ